MCLCSSLLTTTTGQFPLAQNLVFAQLFGVYMSEESIMNQLVSFYFPLWTQAEKKSQTYFLRPSS